MSLLLTRVTPSWDSGTANEVSRMRMRMRMRTSPGCTLLPPLACPGAVWGWGGQPLPVILLVDAWFPGLAKASLG